jgi:hypothetical protein
MFKYEAAKCCERLLSGFLLASSCYHVLGSRPPTYAAGFVDVLIGGTRNYNINVTDLNLNILHLSSQKLRF